MSLIEEVPFENIFAFNYSPRPLTKAARFADQVPDATKSERLSRLLLRHREIAFEIVKRYDNSKVKVLVEKFNPELAQLTGRSTQNKQVHFLGPESLIGEIVEVMVSEARPMTLRGELVN